MTAAEREQRKAKRRRIARARARELDRLPDWEQAKPPPRRSKSGRPDSGKFPRLPAGPLVRIVDRHFARIEIPGTRFTSFCGTSERRLRDWRRPGALVAFDRADKVLADLNLLWWDVWTEKTVRRAAFYVTYWPSHGVARGRAYTEPDLEELALVEYAFTGEGPYMQGEQLALGEAA